MKKVAKEKDKHQVNAIQTKGKQSKEGMGLNYLRMSRGSWVKNSTLKKVCFP